MKKQKKSNFSKNFYFVPHKTHSVTNVLLITILMVNNRNRYIDFMYEKVLCFYCFDINYNVI